MAAELTVHVVDDDAAVRDSLHWLIDSVGIRVATYESAAAFLEAADRLAPGCVLLDVRLRDMSGLEVHETLKRRGCDVPVIFITGHGDIAMAVEAMKRGAVDFITKPLNDQKLLDAIQRVFSREKSELERGAQRSAVLQRLASLSSRERQVLEKVVQGKLNKIIADELDISTKTVEAHRARVMEKMQARNVADLIRQVLMADQT